MGVAHVVMCSTCCVPQIPINELTMGVVRRCVDVGRRRGEEEYSQVEEEGNTHKLKRRRGEYSQVEEKKRRGMLTS